MKRIEAAAPAVPPAAQRRNEPPGDLDESTSSLCAVHEPTFVAAEGLRRAGTGVTRESLIAALDRIEALELGGLRVGFGKGNRIGGHFVDVAVIGQDGRMLS